jgi:hypothetical protein
MRLVGVPKNLKVRPNVPTKPQKRDPYCDDRTGGTPVSRITRTVQITVTDCNLPASLNSSPNLPGLTDRNC